MSYRCIYVKHANLLNLKNNNLIVKKEEKEVIIPLEDIALVLLEDNQCNVSAKLLSALSSYYIGLIVCDNKYMPTSITLPLHMHYKQLKVFQLQMNVKKPIMSQAWERIIRKKIINQISVLKQTSKDEFYLSKLSESLKELRSNDKTNREAIAAKYFFSGLYGTMFVRRRKSEDEINVALNYGYTVLMACTARILAMYGFNTILGIHHVSYVNNFNLACDLMEPFRPLIDRCVYNHVDDLSYPLSSQIKKELIEVLVDSVRINEKTYLVEHAIEEVVLSYIKVLETEDILHLKLPEIIEVTKMEEIDESEL